MIQDVASEQDINAVAHSWDRLDSPRKIARIEDLPDLEEGDGEEIQWVVEGIIAQGALHMITSESGAGKSTLISASGSAVSLGTPFMDRATSRRPVLILDAENPRSVVLERFNRLGIRTHAMLKVWGQWIGEGPPAAGGAIVLDWIARSNPKPLIIVDSVIAFHPGAENDSNETRRYMAQYRQLTAMGVTIILLHHTGKSETSKEYRGSSDYKASIDIGYNLKDLGDGMRLSSLELRAFKQRFTVEPRLRILYNDGIFSAERAEIQKDPSEILRELLQSNPGTTKDDFAYLAAKRGLTRSQARSLLDRGVNNCTVRVELGPKNRHSHFWTGASAE